MEKKNKSPRFVEGDVTDIDYRPLQDGLTDESVISQIEVEELRKETLQQKLP